MSSAYRWNAVVLPHTQPRFVICPTNIVFTGTFFCVPLQRLSFRQMWGFRHDA
jgi:hypothetical protein